MKPTKVTVMFIAAVAICAALASSAKAQCGFAQRHNLNALSALNAPAVPMPSARENSMVLEALARNREEPTIVGLWDVKFMSEDQLFVEFRDLSGNPLPGFPDVSGNLVGDRITVD